MNQCYISATSRKDGSPWYDRHGNEWQRYWCGHPDHSKCRTSIPKKTGQTRSK